MCTPFITQNQVCTVSIETCFYHFKLIKIQITAVTYVLGLYRLFFCYAVGTDNSLAWPPERSRNCISFSHTEGGGGGGGAFWPEGASCPTLLYVITAKSCYFAINSYEVLCILNWKFAKSLLLQQCAQLNIMLLLFRCFIPYVAWDFKFLFNMIPCISLYRCIFY